jgi:two-component system, NarL family, sensor histidine kinase DesK
MSMSSPGAWLRRRRRVSLSALFLVYLLYVGIAVAGDSRGVGEVAGFVVLGAFALTYLEIVDRAAQLGGATFVAAVGLLLALMVAEVPFARATGLNLLVYITAVLIMRLGERAWPVVVVFALGALFVPTLVPGWHDTLGDSIGLVTPIAVPVVALLSFGLREIAKSNFALAEARAEVARLGAEAERARIARDLHDLLGHSLTTITVKAGLARRIGQTDPERALEEITAVENLARRSLQDVRATVAGYREVTLTGELAAGRELLRAAGIAAELPSAVDVVDPAHQELFGWVVREGVTNVVRHARASFCAVRVSCCLVEIVDDGANAALERGNDDDAWTRLTPGNGLTGLRERVASAGGTLEAGPCRPSGWRLRVSLPEPLTR